MPADQVLVESALKDLDRIIHTEKLILVSIDCTLAAHIYQSHRVLYLDVSTEFGTSVKNDKIMPSEFPTIHFHESQENGIDHRGRLY